MSCAIKRRLSKRPNAVLPMLRIADLQTRGIKVSYSSSRRCRCYRSGQLRRRPNIFQPGTRTSWISISTFPQNNSPCTLVNVPSAFVVALPNIGAPAAATKTRCSLPTHPTEWCCSGRRAAAPSGSCRKRARSTGITRFLANQVAAANVISGYENFIGRARLSIAGLDRAYFVQPRTRDIGRSLC